MCDVRVGHTIPAASEIPSVFNVLINNNLNNVQTNEIRSVLHKGYRYPGIPRSGAWIIAMITQPM